MYNAVRRTLTRKLYNNRWQKMTWILREALKDIHLPTKKCKQLMPHLRIRVGIDFTFQYNMTLYESFGSSKRVYQRNDLSAIIKKQINQMVAIKNRIS